MKTGTQFKLPSKRQGSFTEWLNKIPLKYLALLGLAVYLVIPVILTLVEENIGIDGHFTSPNLTFRDVLYFNYISILTIGYGDISPTGSFRLYTIGEAIVGLAFYSLMVSIITMKLILPRKNVIIFSKYAWPVQPPVRVPFVTNSVQTFYLRYKDDGNPVNLDYIIQRLHQFDCLRIGLSGSLGMSSYSTYVQYDLKDILIIEDRTTLTKYKGFYEVDRSIHTKEFQEMFHYCPSGSSTLEQKLKDRL